MKRAFPAEEVKNKNIKLIYISSDSVYDGIGGNFSEEDNVNPQNYYGTSKYEGELEILKAENSLIFRTNIFGWNIQNKKSLGVYIRQS
ncbi:sugar nucleotide-binding protein [Thermodesulfobacteriota bacterium]